MEQKDFYTARNLKNLEKIEYLKDELPSFVDEYFLGIENQTSTLTRLNYAYDLRIFLIIWQRNASKVKPYRNSFCPILKRSPLQI